MTYYVSKWISKLWDTNTIKRVQNKVNYIIRAEPVNQVLPSKPHPTKTRKALNPTIKKTKERCLFVLKWTFQRYTYKMYAYSEFILNSFLVPSLSYIFHSIDHYWEDSWKTIFLSRWDRLRIPTHIQHR